ncbi:MAG: multicopper oxidase domain-containing protein, partial [Planctomyces sp.]
MPTFSASAINRRSLLRSTVAATAASAFFSSSSKSARAAALPTKHLLPIDPTLDGAYNYMLNTPNPEVRTITQLHGGHTRPEHDGFPEHWYVQGSSRDNIYDNNQPAYTLWYHDHAMGSTRLNVYAGLAGFYLLRDKTETALNLPRGTFEVPLA